MDRSPGAWRWAIRILVTNDDGVQACGLWELVKALAPENQVTVVAPDREQSGVGTAISLHRILRVKPVQAEVPSVTAYAVEGTPGDCVILGIGRLCPDAELVIAGINEGANLGDDVFISGTVGAALQARFRGLPAMAVSISDLGSEHYETAARVAARLVRALADGELPADTLLNINVPDLPAREIRGVVVARQARRKYSDAVREETDARGKVYFWLVRGHTEWEDVEGTDIWAIRNGLISIIPLDTDVRRDGEVSAVQALCGPVQDDLRE